MEPTPDAQAAVAHAAWTESSARAVLQLMVESVAEMVGFEVAALSVVLGEELVTIAYAGPEEHRAFIEESDPVSVIGPVLARAVPWGPRLRFIESTALDELEGHWVEVDQAGSDDEDAWRPDHGLLAVLSNDHGEVAGILSVDRPTSGRHPDERQRRLLERYAAQAERAVLTLVERQALVEEIAHAESARRLVRAASRPTHQSLDDVLRHTHGPLIAGFDARGSWLQVFGPDGPVAGALRTHDGGLLPIDQRVVDLVAQEAPRLWAEERAVVMTLAGPPDVLPDEVRDHLLQRDVASVLGVALGVGDECVGFLALSRHADQPDWSPVEVESALRIGHDLGAALVTVQALERERALVRQLQELDDYRSQLVATLSHELRTPLTVIAGNLELLGLLGLEPRAERYREAMGRGAQRMTKVVDDLLLLARISDPQHPLERIPVDLRAVVDDVVALVDSTADAKGLVLEAEGPQDLLVPGDPAELDRLVTNLVSNAVKYTPPGGTVRVEAARRADAAVLRVADDGLGISEQDQRGLFRAFFRTANPEALREPGTGLGLATVASIVDRHGGSVEVASRLGAGTTFTVTLPTA